MELKKREEIVKALECCQNHEGDNCHICPYHYTSDGFNHNCKEDMCTYAFALINELTVERDELKQHNDYLKVLIDNAFVKKLQDCNEISATKAVAEAEMWRRIALREKELIEENERLRDALNRTEKALIVLDKAHNELFTDTFRIEAEAKADTVRKMQEKIKAKSEYGTINISPWQLDQIAKELLEENK